MKSYGILFDNTDKDRITYKSIITNLQYVYKGYTYSPMSFRV